SAEGLAYGQLALAHLAAREKKIGHIGAGNQEQQYHRAGNHEKLRLHRPNQHSGQRTNLDAPAFVCVRELGVNYCRVGIQVRLRLFERDSRFQLANADKKMRDARVHTLVQERQRQPDLRLGENRWIRRQDSHNSEAAVIQGDGFAYNARIRAEMRTPNAISEDSYLWQLELLVRGHEAATENRPDAQSV